MSFLPESTTMNDAELSKSRGRGETRLRGHPRHDSYYSKRNERVLAEGCGAEEKAPHLGGISPQKRSGMVRNGMEDGPVEPGEVGCSGGAPCARLGSLSGRRSGVPMRKLNMGAVCVLQAMAVETPGVRGGSSDSVCQTNSGRYLGDRRMRKAPRDTALQTEESEPKRCEVVQCRRLLGDVAMEGAHVQRRWANGLRNRRQLAITVTIDPPTTANLQTEESGPKRCEVVQCRRILGDVAMEEAHV